MSGTFIQLSPTPMRNRNELINHHLMIDLPNENHITPNSSFRSHRMPSLTPSSVNSDRFIPSRSSSNLLEGFAIKSPENIINMNNKENTLNSNEKYENIMNDEHHFQYKKALKNVLFGEKNIKNINNNNNRMDQDNDDENSDNDINIIKNIKKQSKYCEYIKDDNNTDQYLLNSTPEYNSPKSDNDSVNNKKFTFKKIKFESPKKTLSFRDDNNLLTIDSLLNNSLTPISSDTQQSIIHDMKRINKLNIANNIKSKKYISKEYYKVLSTPELTNDFYTDILDWSKNNIVLVALGNKIYTWNKNTQKTTKILTLTTDMNKTRLKYYITSERYSFLKQYRNNFRITATKFSPNGNQIVIGSNGGKVTIFDLNKLKEICCFHGPNKEHIGVIEWNNYFDPNVIVSATKMTDCVNFYDLRNINNYTNIKCGTRVVSLKFEPFKSGRFAIGGRDRCVSIWDIKQLNKGKQYNLRYHKASIRGLSWSPHNSGIIASGGGNNDTKICIWNTNVCVSPNMNNNKPINSKYLQINKPLKCIRTRSQVCNLIWDPVYSNQILSTHGYSPNSNSSDIILWNLKKNKEIIALKGHKNRVLFVALGENNTQIVTGSEDKTIKFWKVFDNKKTNNFGYNLFNNQIR